MDPETLMMLFGGGMSQPGVDPRMLDPLAAQSSVPLAPLPIQPTPNLMPPPIPQAAPPPQEAYRSTPMDAGPEAYRSEPMVQPGATPTSLGAALEPVPGGVPMPKPRPAEAPQATTAPGAAGNDLLKTLRGVQAPATPTPQKVSTPHAPTVAKIQGGALADLLASLGIGPQQALPGLKLPSTLGQALGGR